jgi:hypothetical protein
MAAIAWTDVIDGAAAEDTAYITAVDVPWQLAILAMVNSALNTSLFTDGGGGESSPKLYLARVYLALHYAKVGPRATVQTGQSEFDLSESYALIPLPPGDDPFWYLTGYGLAYRATIRATPVARMPWVV